MIYSIFFTPFILVKLLQIISTASWENSKNKPLIYKPTPPPPPLPKKKKLQALFFETKQAFKC